MLKLIPLWSTVAVIFGSAVFWPMPANAQRNAPSAQQTNPTLCDPIGRIAQGSSQNYRPGEVVCSGSSLIAPVDVQFLCFINATLIPVTGEQVVINLETCTTPNDVVSLLPGRTCNRTGLSRVWCFVPKGPEEQFQVLEPDVVSGPRPTIAWEAVPQAESYTVYILGGDVRWQRTVPPETTTLSYPQAEPSLVMGAAYEVLIAANDTSQEVLATASQVVNVSTAAHRVSLQLATSTKGAQ
ncbi:MAG: hypothetical protein ABG776_00115 [Cyanobacteria bacterium J06555_13]